MYLVYYHEQQTKIHLLRKKRLQPLYAGSAQPDKWNKKRKRLVRKIACENCRKFFAFTYKSFIMEVFEKISGSNVVFSLIFTARTSTNVTTHVTFFAILTLYIWSAPRAHIGCTHDRRTRTHGVCTVHERRRARCRPDV